MRGIEMLPQKVSPIRGVSALLTVKNRLIFTRVLLLVLGQPGRTLVYLLAFRVLTREDAP
jgi:hypothetical protein